jgi:hypothetical protein
VQLGALLAVFWPNEASQAPCPLLLFARLANVEDITTRIANMRLIVISQKHKRMSAIQRINCETIPSRSSHECETLFSLFSPLSSLWSS